MNEITNCNVSYVSGAGNKIELTLGLARKALNIDEKVSDVDIYTFLKMCEHQKLDPFLGEIHFIYVKGKVQKVVGIDTFTNRLNEHPLCEGWQAGLLLEQDGKIIEQKGTFYLKTQKIVGAYFSLKRQGWKDDFYWSIPLHEYYREYYDKDSKTHKPMGQWGTMTATMIVKCVIAASCRKVFPKSFTGLYSSEEFGESSDNTKTSNDNFVDTEYEEIINNEQLKTLYETAKSTNKEIKIDSEKLCKYVIDELIRQKKLEPSIILTSLPVSKINLVLEWIKKSVELKEKKFEELKKKNAKVTLETPPDGLGNELPVEDTKIAKPVNNDKKKADKKKEDKKE